MKKLVRTMTVGKQDITKGLQDHRMLCPVARAGRRACKGATFVEVDGAVMDVGYGTKDDRLQHFQAKLPEAARRFIRQFDNGDVVMPATFALTFTPVSF